MLRRCLLPTSALCTTLIITACTASSPSESVGKPSSAARSPQSKAKILDLGPRSPPDFNGGALGVWSTRKRIKVWRHWDDSKDPKLRLETKNPIGQRLNFLALAARRDKEGIGWFKILLPERPNGSRGWIHSGPMHVVAINDRIEVDLSSFSLRHFHQDHLVDSFTVATGAPQYPTPTGTFYLWASVPQSNPNGPYGSYALGLSGFSPVLSEWPGGGRAAIHGTAIESDKGRAVSHGCIRVFNPDIDRLKDLPLGTPVIISS